MKISNNLLIPIFSWLTVIFLACRKDGDNPNQSLYFPNKVGDTWQYNVTDSASSTPNNPSPPTHYVVNVSITSIVKLLDGKEAALWQYQYPWGNDTNYVRLTKDTIKIFYNTYSKSLSYLNYPSLIFLTPFQVNERWNGKLYGVDSARVIDERDVNTGAQTFKNCFDIYRYYSGPNIELKDHYIFKPFIGLVSKNFVDYQNAPILFHSWQLKNFSIH